MMNLVKKVELIANLAIVVVALLVVAATVKSYFAGPGAPFTHPHPNLIGTKIALAGEEWQASKKTIVLALSVDCRFCSESGPFYQELARRVSAQNGARLIAVFPQAQSEAREYLKQLSVPIEDVRQLSLETIGVRGTPTLMIVDDTGEITDAWVGQLPVEAQAEVLRRLSCETCGQQ